MKLYDYARAYLGVPFKHRGRDSRGLDCAGLVWCSYRDAGVTLPDLARYGREPNRQGAMMDVIRRGAGSDPIWTGRKAAAEVKQILQPGDVFVMRFEIEPHHVAIVTPNEIHGLGMIHADGQIGVRKVVEHGMMDWHFERVLAIFRRPV